MFAAGAGGEDGEPLVAVLEAVAVRAGVRADPPDLGEARNVGHLVEHARGEEHGPRQVRAAGRGDAEGAVEPLGVLDLGGHDLDAVAAEFRAAAGAQVRRVEAIVAEHAVHLMGGVVARLGTVEDQDASARAAEHERGVETGRPGADDDAVPGPAVGIAVHRSSRRR